MRRNGWTWVVIGAASVACAATAVLAYRRYRAQKPQHARTLDAILEDYKRAFDTPLARLRKVADALVVEMNSGLTSNSASRLKMLVSYVDKLPTGRETGVFYALDLGGTNFRVIRTKLQGSTDEDLVSKESHQAVIPPHLMVGTTEDLFDYIAQQVAVFVESEGPEFECPTGHVRELGFTFSFPVNQTAIDGGTLLTWTKGFNIPEAVGEDVVALMEDALQRKGVNMRVAALVNDTVGTLVGGRFLNADVVVGVILGTGTNACYVENADAIPKLEGPKPASGLMVINTEWGNFATPHLPLADVDYNLDGETPNQGQQIFEKALSGMYLGDIVRRILVRMSDDGSLFGVPTPRRMRDLGTLSTPDISKMHMDPSPGLDVARDIFAEKYGLNTTLEQRAIIRDVITLVAQRGARLAAAGIVAILKKIGRDGGGCARHFPFWHGAAPIAPPVSTVVAMDGGLYEHYTVFRNSLLEAVREMLGDEAAKTVNLELTKDGSGLGAALIAASYSLNGQ